MKKLVKSVFKKMGFSITKIHNEFRPKPDKFLEHVIETVQPYTMTDAACITALVDAVNYIETNKIEGDFVECGVWKGGSILAMIECLKNNKSFNRDLYLYDTFEGMSAPSEHDKLFSGEDAGKLLKESDKSIDTSVWVYAPLEIVKKAVLDKGYPNEKIHMVRGKVEDTIPGTIPKKIALLRLDTDFYESTKHELEYLFPLLSDGGVLIIDDYGCWQGARKAVDEYFATNNTRILLNSINWTAKIAVKQ